MSNDKTPPPAPPSGPGSPRDVPPAPGTAPGGNFPIDPATLPEPIRKEIEAPDPVAKEVRKGRAEALRAGLTAIDGDTSIEAKLLRKEFEAAIETSVNPTQSASLDELPGNEIRRTALAAARRRANELRLAGTIGDEAYRTLESEFDWGELSAGADA